MLDGRLTRLVILALLLTAPIAGASPPRPDRTTADPADGQDITDMAIDPTGQFVASVVAFDNAKLAGGLLPTNANAHDDVYLCDYGPSTNPSSGNGCRGLRHDSTQIVTATQPPNAPQRVAAASIPGSAVFAVVGPDRYVSYWRATSDQPDWTVSTQDNYAATNVTIARDGSRVVVATVPASPTASGRIEVYQASNHTRMWFIALETSQGNLRATSLDHSRTGNVLAIGTDDGGVLFADPSGARPTSDLGGIVQPDGVSKVQLSGDGRFVVAAASNGVFLATLERVGGRIDDVQNSVFSRTFGEAAQDAAISLDGSRFAAAAGSKVHFFRRLDTAAAAEPTGEAFDTGARIVDMAYDEKGQLLVVASGNSVFGFGPSKTTPIWRFDATQSAFGSVDGPLRRVSVSDDGQRIIVAGKTEMMAFSSVLAVQASLASTSGSASVAPTQEASLTLTVKNTGSLPDNYTFSIVPPVGWPSTSAEPLRLDPDETGTARFNVTAPAGQTPGVYGVQVRVRSQATDDLAARRNLPTTYIAGPSFNFTIPRSVVLKVEAPDDRLNLRQGAEQTIAITLRNEGNAEGVVNLSVRQELTRGVLWDVRYSSEQVRVPASGSASVNVIVRAPSDAGSGDRNVITLRAREGDTVEATDQVIAYVDPQFGAELGTNRTTWEFFPGQTLTIRLNVTNRGNTEDTYNLTQTITPAAFQNDWRVTVQSPQVTLARGATKQVDVSVKAVASDARESTLTLRAISQASSTGPDKEETSLVLNLLTVPRPPTDDDDRLLPAPGAALALGLLALVAWARRGGRR